MQDCQSERKKVYQKTDGSEILQAKEFPEPLALGTQADHAGTSA